MGSSGSAGLPCPPWRKTTQSRLTISAHFFAKLSTRPLCFSIQRGRMATSNSLIRHGSISPVCRWRICWDGVGPSCIHPEDVEALMQKMRESFVQGKPLQETSRVRRANGV